MRISDWSSVVCSSDLYSATTARSAITCPRCSSTTRRTPSPATTCSPAKSTAATRSEERRVGKGGGSTCSFRLSPYHENKKKNKIKKITNNITTNNKTRLFRQ